MKSNPARIAVLHFSHETVTFLKDDTTVDDFTYEGSPASGEELLSYDPRGYMGGFVKLAREFEGVELVGIESPLDSKRGTGSGWITEEAFEFFLGKMISELKTEGAFNGAFLALHGAMGVRGVPRPEAEIARRVREVIGPAAFIAATFDPHGNEDEQFLHHADMAFTVKYFPHYDSYLQGARAARTLVRAIRGDYKPAHVTLKVPIITPTVVQWTGASPWMDMIQRALTWEAREPDVYVNFFFGFPWSDVPDVGITFQVLTNGDPDLAQRIGRDMADTAWRKREELTTSATVHRVSEGVSMAKQAVEQGQTPVVLADHSDRSGYATWVLQEVIKQDLSKTLIATVADAKAIEVLTDKGVKAGDPFEMEVGGRIEDSAGDAVRIQGEVISVGEITRRGASQLTVNVKFGRDNVLVISPYLSQIIEPSALESLGLNPADFDVIALKSRVHFRRGFDDSGFAKAIIVVEPDEPFLGTLRLDGLEYQNVDLKQYYPYGDPVYS